MMCKNTIYFAQPANFISQIVIIVVCLIMAVAGSPTVIFAFQAEPFKPFVLIDLEEVFSITGGEGGVIPPSGVTGGRASDVNKYGQTVINFMIGTNDVHPYVFEPFDGGSFAALDKGNNEYAAVHAVNSPADPANAVAVGYVKSDSGAKPKAVYWEKQANGNWSNYVIIPGISGNYASEAVDINKDNKIIGRIAANDSYTTPTSFIYLIGGSVNPLGNNITSYAKCISNNNPAEIVGEYLTGTDDWHAFYLIEGVEVFTELIEQDTDWSSAYAINNALNITGWRWPAGAIHGPSYWDYNQGSWDWTKIILPLGMFPDASGRDLNSRNEVVVSYDDGTLGAFLWSDYGLINLNDVTLILDAATDENPNNDAYINEVFAINDNGWIAGNYYREGAIASAPCLLIPYDTDNNTIPDYREIMENQGLPSDLDIAGRTWLLDKSEHIRVGLHAPNTDPQESGGVVLSELADYIQSVRFASNQNRIEKLITIKSKCEEYQGYFQKWGDYSTMGGSGGSEIILISRSVDNQDSTKDGIPPNESQTELTRSEVLGNLYLFAYRFANCIDYIQLGNEMIGGPGSYVFEEDQLTCIGVRTTIDMLEDDCADEAWALLIGWFGDMNKSALYGSALAGRPLRIYTPALTFDQSVIGVDGDPNGPYEPIGGGSRAARALQELITFANESQCIFDQHMRYSNWDGVGHIMEGINTSQWWDPPQQIGNLEVGPIPSDTWQQTHNESFKAYYWDYGPPENTCPEIYDVTDDWDVFLVNDWEEVQFLDYGFMIEDHATYGDGLFTVLYNYNSLHALWGDTQHSIDSTCESTYIFDILALRANMFHTEWLNPYPYWTIFNTAYQNASGPYVIPDFYPHPNTDDCDCWPN